MNNEVEKNKMENNSKKKIIILIIIIVGTLLLLGISIFINSINNSNSRFYDYKKLINSAEERNNYFKLDCNLEDKNNNINCKIKLNSEVTNSIDSSYILEYLLLDFEDTDDLEIVSIDTKRVYDEELPSYFDVSKSNNRLLIENKDQRVGSDIYFDHNYYTKGTCGKKDNVDYTNKLYLICNDSLENLEIDVKLKLLNENLDKVDIKNFGTLYVYLCDYGNNTSICKNYKYSKLYTSVKIKEKGLESILNNYSNNNLVYMEDDNSPLLSPVIRKFMENVAMGDGTNSIDNVYKRRYLMSFELDSIKNITPSSEGQEIGYVDYDVYKEKYYNYFGSNYNLDDDLLTLQNKEMCNSRPSIAGKNVVCWALHNGLNSPRRFKVEKQYNLNNQYIIEGVYQNGENKYLNNGVWKIVYDLNNNQKYLNSIVLKDD